MEPKPKYDPEYIRDISEKVYRKELNRNNTGHLKMEAENMIAKDGDSGEKLRNRAGAYDALTRVYLETLGIPAPRGL